MPAAIELDRPIERASSHFLDTALRQRARALDANVILGEVPSCALKLTDEQYDAVLLVGEFRDPLAARNLLRLVASKQKRPRRWFDKADPIAFASSVDDYPAALALTRIGLPAVSEINAEIIEAKGKMDPIRLEMFSRVLVQVLGRATVPHLKKQKDHAPDSAAALYDSLLQMPAVKGTDHRIKSLESTDEVKILEQ